MDRELVFITGKSIHSPLGLELPQNNHGYLASSSEKLLKNLMDKRQISKPYFLQRLWPGDLRILFPSVKISPPIIFEQKSKYLFFLPFSVFLIRFLANKINHILLPPRLQETPQKVQGWKNQCKSTSPKPSGASSGFWGAEVDHCFLFPRLGSRGQELARGEKQCKKIYKNELIN